MSDQLVNNFVGVDPGFTGALARINADASIVQVWDMPITKKDKDRQREFDLYKLLGLLRSFGFIQIGECTVGLEWPTTRPGEGAERSERFGRGKGLLEGMMYVLDLDYEKIPPNLWKGRLGVPGKTHPGANKVAAEVFDLHYPDHGHLIRGPRGGILSGRVDALLIAHFMRTRSAEGIRGMQEQYGKGSDEMVAFMLGAGRRGQKRKPGGESFLP